MKITMKRNKKDYSENKINVYQICLVALAVGINIVGGQIALLYETAGLSGQHWNYSDRCSSGTVVWYAAEPDQWNFYGYDQWISIRYILHLWV